MSIVVVGTVGYDTIETQSNRAVEALGGSATYFSLAARFFAPVSIVAAVGTDFKPHHRELFAEGNICLRGLCSREGLPFRWHGRYHEDMNRRDTLNLALNVFADFVPKLLPDQRRADFLFLANISPQLQAAVLDQMANPKIVAADTMNHWIETSRPELIKLLDRIDILTLNDEEARMLSGESNLVKAGRDQIGLARQHPRLFVVKRKNVDAVEQFDQFGTRGFDPMVHGVGGDNLRIGHLIQDSGLQLGRNIGQEQEIGAPLIGKQLGNKIRKDIERQIERIAPVHVLVVAPVPSKSQPLAAFQPAQIDVAFGKELAMVGLEIRSHGSHYADRRKKPRGQ